MCVTSMVMEHYQDKFTGGIYPWIWTNIQPVTRTEFDQLKRDIEEMKALLKRAKKYDEDNNEPDCEMAEKISLIKKVAEIVGVDLSELRLG